MRNLEPSGDIDEVLFRSDSGKAISNIVLMGIGEPLDNFDNVMRFLELVNRPGRREHGMRHISLSTWAHRALRRSCRTRYAAASVSLHAPDDETRSKIMPANRGRGVDALISACRRYYEKTGRRISARIRDDRQRE